ncbi:MAG: acylneuraminate cytidylyltransferase family protein [bacterium]|nr:acylneuraminate cytidylyltransferase family protein [bacterium]MDD5756678.1 acylneuraminate cytidylyltransferase family protein [bacterium]
MTKNEMNKSRIVAIIPARGGSKGLPRKNIKLLDGKPLIAYTIEAAKQCQLIDRIIVSTDDQEIAKVAKASGAEVPFIRPAELSQDDTTTEAVLKHCVEWLEQNEQYQADIVVFLQLTDVFRSKYMLQETVQKILSDPSLDSVFVATKTHKNYWRRVDGKMTRLAPDLQYGPRQKREPLYREDTGLACATRVAFIKQGKRLGEQVEIVINREELPSVDIHDSLDLWLAEILITEKGYKPNQ